MGCQKLTEVDSKGKLWSFYEKRLATEAAADALGEEGKGYVAGISGGDAKPGFPTKQGRLGGLEEKKHRSVQVMHCGCQYECSQLGYYFNQ